MVAPPLTPPTPALPGMPPDPSAPPDPGAAPDDSDSGGASGPEQELIDAAKAIQHITKQANGYLLTFADGQELLLRPGDAHLVGPVDTQTTFDAQDGNGPVNLHATYHAGDLPADLHQMIQGAPSPTAAEAGLLPPPTPVLPGQPPPSAP